MLKKYLGLIGIIISLFLLFIAATISPGGSLFDKNSAGFDWSKNFIGNLFGAKAVNRLENPFRIWVTFSFGNWNILPIKKIFNIS